MSSELRSTGQCRCDELEQRLIELETALRDGFMVAVRKVEKTQGIKREPKRDNMVKVAAPR